MICFVAMLVCFFNCNVSYASVHYQFSSVVYCSTYELHLQYFDEWLACGGSANDVWNDICTFYEDLCGYVVCSTIVFFHSFCAPEQSQVFKHNFNVLHQ